MNTVWESAPFLVGCDHVMNECQNWNMKFAQVLLFLYNNIHTWTCNMQQILSIYTPKMINCNFMLSVCTSKVWCVILVQWAIHCEKSLLTNKPINSGHSYTEHIGTKCNVDSGNYLSGTRKNIQDVWICMHTQL